MDDDFNTANAMAAIFELVKTANVYLLEKNTQTDVLDLFHDRRLIDLMEVLGLPFDGEELLDDEIEGLIEERFDSTP